MRTDRLALLIAPVLLSGCIHTGGSSPLDLIPLSERALMLSGGAEPQSDGQKVSVNQMLARARQTAGAPSPQPLGGTATTSPATINPTAPSVAARPSLRRPLGLWSQPAPKASPKAAAAIVTPAPAPAPKQPQPTQEPSAREQRIEAVKTAAVPEHTQREREALRQAMFWTNAARRGMGDGGNDTQAPQSGFQNAVIQAPAGPDLRLPDVPKTPEPRPEARPAIDPSQTPSVSTPAVPKAVGHSIEIDAPGNGLSGQLVIAAGKVLQEADGVGATSARVETPDTDPMPLGEMRDAVAVSKLLKTGGLDARIAPCGTVRAGKIRVRLGAAEPADVGACQQGSEQ